MTANDFLSTLMYWAPQGVDVASVNAQALDIAAAYGANADAATNAALSHILASGLKPLRSEDLPGIQSQVRAAVVTAIGLSRHTSDALADAYRIGHEMYADAQGRDVLPAPWDADTPGFVSAWEDGRANCPDYHRHKMAQKAATARLKERFGMSEPATQKAYLYWLKCYFKARNTKAVA